MTDVGFWNIARSSPDRVAVLADDGTQITYGALLAEQNRVANGLAALATTPAPPN